MYVVGLEVSTVSAKAVLCSATGEVLAVSSRPLSAQESTIVWQDPGGIFQATLDCLREVVDHAKRTHKPIRALGLGGIWHSLLLLDENRQPLEGIRTWADLSMARHLVDVKRDLSFVEWFYHKTGCVVHAMYPFWKLYGLRREAAPILKQAHYISSQVEYLFERFTNKTAISPSLASGTGLFNTHDLAWDQELLHFIELESSMLPPVQTEDYAGPLSKEMAELVGLSAGIPVTVGHADGALNQIGSGALSSGIMTFSVGTSGAIRLTTPTPLLGTEAATWCYYLRDGKWLAGAATHAGSNLNWFMDLFGCANSKHESLARQAEELAVSQGPLFLPFVFGERAPGWQEERTGGFLGMRPEHGLEHLYKAVLEGILFALYHSYLKLKDIGDKPSEIRLSGGIMNSPYWRQMAADIFGEDLFYTGVVHESTVGAALLALKACGGVHNLQSFRPPLQGKITPDAQRHQLYGERFQQYLRYYDCVTEE